MFLADMNCHKMLKNVPQGKDKRGQTETWVCRKEWRKPGMLNNPDPYVGKPSGTFPYNRYPQTIGYLKQKC